MSDERSFTLAHLARSGKETVWCLSVCLSVPSRFPDVNVTHQGAARNAAGVCFGPSVRGPIDLLYTLSFLSLFAMLFSGPGRAIGLLCLCLWTITIELNDL